MLIDYHNPTTQPAHAEFSCWTPTKPCIIACSHTIVSLKPHSHRIVRFLDRTIGCDWPKVRPIGNVCYDIQQRSHTAINLYASSRYHVRLENINDKSHRRKSCGYRGSDHRPMYDQSLRPATDATINRIGASGDRSYEHSWHPVTERTINRGTRRPMVRPIVGCNDRSYDQWWLQMIWIRMFDVLNMTIDLDTTVILPWLSPTTYATSRTFFLRFAQYSNLFGRRSYLGRKPGVAGALCDQSYGLVTITLTWIPV